MEIFPVWAWDIKWHSIHLTILLESDRLDEFDFFLGEFEGNFKGVEYPVERVGTELRINIVNIPECKLLGTGKWFVIVKKKATGEVQPLRIRTECGYKLDDLDKVFRYSANCCAYVVTFETASSTTAREHMTHNADKHEFWDDTPSFSSNDLFLRIHTTYLRLNKKQGRRNAWVETRNLVQGLRGCWIRASKAIMNGIYHVVDLIRKKDGKHILLMSETRTPIGGNLKALDERMKERGIDQEYVISYFFTRTLHSGLIKMGIQWMKLLWLVAGQDYIFVDDYAPMFKNIRLSDKVKLIQLWHAGVGFKSVGYSRFGKPGSPHPIDSPHRRYDYAVVGASALIDVYEEVFAIPRDRILPYGLPRLDGYMDDSKIRKFRTDFYQKYPQFRDKKLIMFAPTYRGTGQEKAVYPPEKLDLDKAYQMCGDEYVFVIKMHPFVREIPEIPKAYQDRIFDFSAGWDINELFYVTEILITDFSSNIYEFSLQNKPMIFYAYDKDYYQLTRGVHRRLEEFAPGKICLTFDEIVKTVETKDFEEEKRQIFIQSSFDEKPEHASDKIIETVLGIKA